MSIVDYLLSYTSELTIVSFFIVLFTIFYLYKSIPKKDEDLNKSFEKELKKEIERETRAIINYNTEQLHNIISEMPDKILKSITSSTNTKKGALGELIGYLELRASYDRIIPLGNIVDFIGIKFKTKDEEGCVDFIDIKTGKSARLSKDQKELQFLIENKSINFLKIKVESETIT